MPPHDTRGDSLAPLQVYTSGSAEPGLSEATPRVKVPEDVADWTGCWPDSTGWGDPEGTSGVDGDVVEEHPPKITHPVRIKTRTINRRICITEQQHAG
jgi:hypothetical protein